MDARRSLFVIATRIRGWFSYDVHVYPGPIGKLGHTAVRNKHLAGIIFPMQSDHIEILSEITDIEIIAIGNSIRDLDRLQKKHGRGRWRKLKGFANVRLPDNTTCFAEIHWYEAHGIGKRDIKVKRILGK